jgi:alpha-tubulin suppressor-like RCC1 family protein
MADTKVTVPFNRKYLPGENTTFTKIAISAVVPGSATVIATEKNHGLYGDLDVITVYDNGTNPFINFIEYPATVIDGRRFSIPIDTTNYTTLCSNGYIVKRSSIVGPVRKKQNYKDVALSINLPIDRYIIIEKEKNDFGIQTEVDISMLGIPREEETSTQIEEVTRYGINSVIWQHRGWYTMSYPWGESSTWFNSPRTITPEVSAAIDKYVLPDFPNYYRGTGLQFRGDESCVELFVELAAESAPYFLGPQIESLFPGLHPAGFGFQMLETQRSFKYLPGRANVFTFGIKARVDNAYSLSDEQVLQAYELGNEDFYESPPGNITRWGVGNASDAYYFELSGNGRQGTLSEVAFSVNRRRHYRGDSNLTVKTWGIQTDYNNVQSTSTLGTYPDDPFYCVSPAATKFVSIDPDAPELTKVYQKDFKNDTVDGKGPSGSVIDFDKVTMYKIEFSWYGAAGARFFAYLNQDNDKAEWVCLHEIEGGQLFKEPVLNSPVMQIKYFTFARAGARVSLKKYGVSSYIEGADEGTMIQNTRYTDILKEVSQDPVPLVGISTTDAIKSSFGEMIPNSKLILPSLINISTSENCLVEVVWKPTSNLVQGITKGAELQPLNIPHPSISGTILANNPAAFFLLSAEDSGYTGYDETDSAGAHEEWGAYNLRALSGTFGISGSAAREVLVGARIFQSDTNIACNRFQFKWWDPFATSDDYPGVVGLWSDSRLPPGKVEDNDFVVYDERNPTGDPWVNSPRTRTGIFNTYISAVGDFDPTKGPDDWFKTCVKGDVIWLSSPLSGWANMNMFNERMPGGYGIGAETGTTGPHTVWEDQATLGPELNPTNSSRNNFGHAFVSVYPYVTGSMFEFNLEILDRQAISRETFNGKEEYWISCNLGSSHQGPLREDRYYANTPTYEGYIGRYFLRNYVRYIDNMGSPDPTTNPIPVICTELPHMLKKGEVFTFVHAVEQPTVPDNQLAQTNDRTKKYQVQEILSDYAFTLKVNGSFGVPYTQNVNTVYMPFLFTGLTNSKVYIIKDTLPDYIPLTNINVYPYPYRPSVNNVKNRGAFPQYGLPIDRVSLTEGGGPTLQIYPRGLSRVALREPWYDIRNQTANQRKNTKFQPFTYDAGRPGILFAHASAVNTHMSIGFLQPQTKGIDNVNGWKDLPPKGNRSGAQPREIGEPWRLVFIGHKGASIKDCVVISDYWTQDQQTVSPTWIPLSSVRLTPVDIVTSRMLTGTPGLSCVYPGKSNALTQPPNFVVLKDMPGTAAKLDFQSSQPLYDKGFITASDIKNGKYRENMATRTIAAFYVPKGEVIQYDISPYFGLVAEYLSNTLKKKESQPWNSVYITARTTVSGFDINDFKPKDIAATGYNLNSQFGLNNDSSNKYKFTELQRSYKKIGVGDRHVIVIDNNNQVFVAGSNSHGQLGLPLSIPSVSLFRSLTGSFKDVVCGKNNTFLLSATEDTWFVSGENGYGQLGLGHTNNVTAFTPLSETLYTQIVPGSACTFAKTRFSNQNVWYATGDNTYGQLGIGSYGNSYTTFQRLNDLNPANPGNWKDIVCGNQHTIALSAGPLSSVPVRVVSVVEDDDFPTITTSRVISLSTYNAYSCGLNTSGQLGLGDNNNRNLFTLIGNNQGWTKAAARGNHTLLLSSDNIYHVLYATGDNQYGQLGLNSYQNYNTPQKVVVTNKDLDAICGDTHTAILCGTSLFTAGNNTYGQLGLSAEKDIVSVIYPGFDASPVTVPGDIQVFANAREVISINWSTPLAGLSSLYETGPETSVTRYTLTSISLSLTGAGYDPTAQTFVMVNNTPLTSLSANFAYNGTLDRYGISSVSLPTELSGFKVNTYTVTFSTASSESITVAAFGAASSYEYTVPKKLYTGVIGATGVKLYWNEINSRWELQHLTTELLACTGSTEDLYTSTWTSINNRHPLINNIALITAAKDNRFKLTLGQVLPLSGSPIYCETRSTVLSAYLSKDATFVRRLVLPPTPVYPKAKVYAGLTWREQ